MLRLNCATELIRPFGVTALFEDDFELPIGDVARLNADAAEGTGGLLDAGLAGVEDVVEVVDEAMKAEKSSLNTSSSSIRSSSSSESSSAALLRSSRAMVFDAVSKIGARARGTFLCARAWRISGGRSHACDGHTCKL